jgi:predicted ester cyclase
MTVERNVEVMRRWFDDVWNRGRVETIYELLAENFTGYGQDAPGVTIHGPEGFVALYKRLGSAFSDFKFIVEDAFGVGDKVTVRWSTTMTHTGDFLDMAATHRAVRITGITIARFEGDMCVEAWDNWDQLALVQQISAQAGGLAQAAG